MVEAMKLESLQAQMEELRGQSKDVSLVAGSRLKDFHTRIFDSVT
jgi:hypothetical protein